MKSAQDLLALTYFISRFQIAMQDQFVHLDLNPAHGVGICIIKSVCMQNRLPLWQSVLHAKALCMQKLCGNLFCMQKLCGYLFCMQKLCGNLFCMQSSVAIYFACKALWQSVLHAKLCGNLFCMQSSVAIYFACKALWQSVLRAKAFKMKITLLSFLPR